MMSIYVTCKDMEEAEKIAGAIMRQRAAGCINMFPARSIWRDDSDDKLKRIEEAVLVVKTLESKLQLIEDIVHEVGSYKAPCIAAMPVSRINRPYKEWLGKVVT